MPNHNVYEDELEQAALEWFEELGYETAFAPDLSPGGDYPERSDYSDVILEERLKDALKRINADLPQEALDDALHQILVPLNPALIDNNHLFQKMVTDGVNATFRANDGRIVNKQVRVFDFDEIKNNDFLAVNQFTVIENRVEKRPDVVVFVNGIPLVVIELKNLANEDVEISDAYNQIQNYISTIPSLFTYNAFAVISDGVNARAGTITADEDRFMMWRTIDGDEIAPLSRPQLEVLIKGMFEKEHLLDIIKNFILFQTDGKDTYKILAGYHQYHAVNKAVESTIRAAITEGDRKIGVVWHTQGSGKSLSMVFYVGKLVLSKELNNPTIVVITDRNDLDDQLFSTFAKSKDLLRQEPVQAQDRADLRRLLTRESGGIIFTTIHKFAPEEKGDSVPVLTDRENVIVIADEAHRSQYGFRAEIVKGGTEADVKYGYAKYMRDALPNASFIGFTGTPISLADKDTRAVFGDYIDIYDMTRAVEDGTTVRIFYESRIAKLELPDELKPVIDDEYEEITEYQEYTQKEKLKTKWSRLEAIVGAEQRVKAIAKDIVEHFEKRLAAQETEVGKGMIVVMSRRIAIDLYKAIVELLKDYSDIHAKKGPDKDTYSKTEGSYTQADCRHFKKAFPERQVLGNGDIEIEDQNYQYAYH
jgi:type I restriction enzyme R subunit